MLFRRKCGIDLGTDIIKICDKNEKLTVYEKNMLAIRNKVNVIAIGQRAFDIYEKAPACVEVGCPMIHGAVADSKNLEIVLTGLLKRFSTFFCKSPDILITAPSEISEVERRAFYNVLSGKIKAKRITLIEKGIADAVGIGMPVMLQMGNMVVNIGAATTEISVISEGKVIMGRKLKTGGQALDADIATMVRRRFNLNIGNKTAENLKNKLAYIQKGPERTLEVFGIHNVSGLPRSAEIPSLAVSVSIIETIDVIVDAIEGTLGRIPPQLMEDIRKNGIYLTGGVSVLPNLADYMQKELGIHVYNVNAPADSTLRGIVQIMNDKELRKLTYSLKDFMGKTI